MLLSVTVALLPMAEDSSFRASLPWFFVAVLGSVLVVGSLVVAIVGIFRSRRGDRIVAAVFGWVAVGLALIASFLLIAFPVALFDQIAWVVFAPLIAIPTVLAMLAAILSLTLSQSRSAPG